MATEGTPRKLFKLGITVQSAKGTVAATPTTVFPLPADDSISYSRGDEVLNWGDGTAYAHTILQKIESVGGGLALPLIPAVTSALADWVATEDTEMQGKWATLFFDFDGVFTVRYFDCKVASAALVFNRADTPRLNVTVSGLQRTTGVDLSSTYASELVPYKPSEIYAQLKVGGGAYATVTNLHNITINVDRKLESTDDGAAVAAQTYAEFLSNQGGMGVTGTLDRRMTDDDVWADYIAGTLAAVKVICTRGTSSDTFECPSIMYTPGGDAHAGPGDAIARQSFPFTGLSSGTHFVTAPFAWTAA
jgi:hypothetical protein